MMRFGELKSVMRDLEVKGSAAAATLMETKVRPRAETMARSKGARAGAHALMAVAMASSLATTAFATGGGTPDTSGFEAKIDNAKGTILSFLRNILLAVGTVSLAFCGIVLLFGIGGQRASENAKAWAFRIFIGMAIVLCAEPIINMVYGFFSDAPAGG